jgi:Vacuole effluxer Atg22 like
MFGLCQAPYYAVSVGETLPLLPTGSRTDGETTTQYVQTMTSELTPRGYENMFFSLFGITNRAVS